MGKTAADYRGAALSDPAHALRDFPCPDQESGSADCYLLDGVCAAAVDQVQGSLSQVDARGRILRGLLNGVLPLQHSSIALDSSMEARAAPTDGDVGNECAVGERAACPRTSAAG